MGHWFESAKQRLYFLVQKAASTVRIVANERSAQGTTEYAILVGVLVVIAILAIVAFRGKVTELWDAIASGINSLQIMRSSSRRILWIALALALVSVSLLLIAQRQDKKPSSAGVELSEEEQQAVREIQNVQTKESSRATFLDDLQAQESVGAEGQSRAVIWREESDVPQSAAAALEAYRAQGAGKLMCGGYMDIKGNVWGGIVMSRTWVDIIYVTSTEDGAASTLRIVRLSAENVG